MRVFQTGKFITVNVNEHGVITGVPQSDRVGARSEFRAASSESREMFFAIYEFVWAKLRINEQWTPQLEGWRSYVDVYRAIVPDLRKPGDSKERTANRIAKSMRRLWNFRAKLVRDGVELKGLATPDEYEHPTYADRLCAWLLKIGASYTPPNGSDVSQDDRPLTAPAIGPGVGSDLI